VKAKRKKKNGKYVYTIELDSLEMGTLWTCIGAAMMIAEVGPETLDIDHDMLESLKENYQMFDIERFTIEFLNNPSFLPPNVEVDEETNDKKDDLPN